VSVVREGLHRFRADMVRAAIAAVFIAGLVAVIVGEGIAIFFVTFLIVIAVAPTVWVRLVIPAETREQYWLEYKLRWLALLWALVMGLLIGLVGTLLG
jgi:hypothetical protein